MGIRYYAYAFDAELTQVALADPFLVMGEDPLADAWGLEPGFQIGVTNFEPSLPRDKLLYLDKAWSYLQTLTAPSEDDRVARPAYWMFDGNVRRTGNGWSWHPWVRVITPDEVAVIANDLAGIDAAHVEEAFGQNKPRSSGHTDVDYVNEFLNRAKEFVNELAREGRGFAYSIG